MKKLLALASVVLLAGVVRSFAALGMGDIKFDGALDVTGVSANNEKDANDKKNDSRGDTGTRLRLGMNAQVTEGVMGRVEITRGPNKTTGSAYYGGNTGTDVNTFTTELLINNAYVAFDDLLGLKVKLGRQYVGEAGDLAWHIGVKSDDDMTVNSIQGIDIKKSLMDNKLDLDIFTGKIVNNNAGGTQVPAVNAGVQGDANLSNVALGINNVLPGGTINVAWQDGVNDTTSNNLPATDIKQRLQLVRLGVKGGVMENMWTYRAEYLQDMGDVGFGDNKVKYEGSAIDLGVGANLKDTPVGKFSFALNYALASGNDQTVGADPKKDKSFHDLGAVAPGTNVSDRYFGEIFGKDNALNKGGAAGGQGLNQGPSGAGLKVLNIGAKYVPAKWDGKVSALVDYYMLNTDKKVGAAPNDSDKIGNELDLTLAYAYSANVNIDLGYAMLTPDKVIDSVAANPRDNITKWFSRLNLKWGGEEK